MRQPRADDDARVFVSLGSNLGERARHLAAALRALAELPQTRLHACSPIYETDPVGPPPQDAYLNAVVELRTRLRPRELLDCLLAIEAQQGRVRSTRRNEARTLDLDLLVHGRQVVDEAGLRVPHPRLAERPFVLEPLSDLAPDLCVPTWETTVEELAKRAHDPRAVRPWSGRLPAYGGPEEFRHGHRSG